MPMRKVREKDRMALMLGKDLRTGVLWEFKERG